MSNLEELKVEDVKSFETPCFLVSKNVIKQQFEKIKGITENMDVAYSFKTNPDKEIALLLKSLGSNFSLASFEEAEVLKNIINDLPDVFYVNPGADSKEFKKLGEFGIKNFVINSNEQLKELDKAGLNNVNILLRFNTNVKVNGFYSENSLGMGKNDILSAASKLGPVGIHNHLATQNNDLDSWKHNLSEIVLLVKELKGKAVFVHTLNLGGGLPVDYLDKSIPFDELSKLIQEKLNEIRESFPAIKIVFEPGRFIVGPAAVLVTQVTNVDTDTAYVNDSLYNSHMDTLIVGLELPCYSFGDGVKKTYKIRGNTPDFLDFFRKKVELPELKQGDYIIFTNAGAYNFSSDFLGKKKNKTYVVE